MMPNSFTGDRKAPMRSPLADLEHRLIEAWAPRFPRWIEGYHLTLLTIPWTGGVLAAGCLGRRSLHWLWLRSAMLVLQWFTDSFDGKLGRLRDTGIPRWGFYMDHFLDFLFMSAVFLAYALLLEPGAAFQMVLLMLLYDAMMVSSWLAFGATGRFKITFLGIGPTEIRLLFILINTCLILFGVGWLVVALPWALGVGLVLMCVIVARTQASIWRMDMDEKKNL